jgi:histidinol phosphatase-like PHP family hydrolase
LVEEVVRQYPDMPLVALQHNPLHPAIVSEYPYMLTNGPEVLASYSRAGVVASLSGHYHAGQEPSLLDGVTCYTVPALCESLFAFAHVRVAGRTVQIQPHALRLDAEQLTDVHCHTEYAYCGTTVTAARCLEVSSAMGVGQVCLTEHAFHLYFDKEEAKGFRWQTEPERVTRAWRDRSGRMDAYKRFVQSLRRPGVKLGLEVDLLANGTLLLAPEDRAGWDLLVGAIHTIPGFLKGVTTQAESERLFIGEVERLLKQPITVLAHPFRFFRRAGLATPSRLYPEVARLLAQVGVAAEINFHTNQQDPAFIRECVKQGVRIALGSDAHDIMEVGELAPHLRVLEDAGIHRREWDQVLLKW